MNDIIHDLVIWLREALAWIVLAIAGGTLFALKRGATTIQTWVGVLIKSTIVGFLASRVIINTQWDSGWQWVAVATIAFGADAIIYMVDVIWTRLANDPIGTVRTVINWIASKKIVISNGNGNSNGNGRGNSNGNGRGGGNSNSGSNDRSNSNSRSNSGSNDRSSDVVGKEDI